MPLSQPIFFFFLGVFLIALLDSIGAILSRKMHFKYQRLAFVSFAIYILIGFLLGRTSDYYTTLLYAGLLGLFDSTIGLRLSIYFKANMGLSKERIEQMESLNTSLFVIIFGLVFGSIGFAIGVYG